MSSANLNYSNSLSSTLLLYDWENYERVFFNLNFGAYYKLTSNLPALGQSSQGFSSANLFALEEN